VSKILKIGIVLLVVLCGVLLAITFIRFATAKSGRRTFSTAQ